MEKGGVGKRGQCPGISVVGGSVNAGLGARVIHGLEAVTCGEHPLGGHESTGTITETTHASYLELGDGAGLRGVRCWITVFECSGWGGSQCHDAGGEQGGENFVLHD